MRPEDVRYLLIEDIEDSRRSILQLAREFGLRPDNRIGDVGDLDSAFNIIHSHWRDIDLILLDLNIPANQNDSHPSKDHGEKIIKFIHEDINRRGGHTISIIIVSGEVDSKFEERYWIEHRPTVIGLAAKNEISTSLKNCLSKFFEDPILMEICRTFSEAEKAYIDLTDPNNSANDRSLAGVELGCIILKNIISYEYNRLDHRYTRSHDLNSLIREYVNNNFDPPKINLKNIKIAPQQWILRGYLIEHFYSLNNYRNCMLHIKDTGPFHDGKNDYGIWTESMDVITKLEQGDRLAIILILVAQDILEWYLPWHEKVYLPWRQAKEAEGQT